jgi:branched-subunit amino acid transport protein
MALASALILVLGLAAFSFVIRAAGTLLPNIPTAIQSRTGGLAPALLAALVAIQLTGRNGLVHFDVKVPAVLVAVLLAALRMPFIVCVVAGALVAAALRAFLHLN